MIRVGQRLKETRLEKGLSLEDVAQATKIRASFLSAIEKGEYQKLPSSSYAQGFVQNYADFLGLPRREIMALFRREFDEEKVYKVLPEGFVKEEHLHRRSIKIHQALLIVFGVLLFLGGFLFYQYRAAFFNPDLEVSEPQGRTVTTSDIVVRGKTDQNVTVTVNNIPVAIDESGNFSKRVSVFPGENSIVIRAVNTFGRETQITRDITLKSTP